jgi:hypothetical protein
MITFGFASRSSPIARIGVGLERLAPHSQRESLINGSVLYASNGAVLSITRPVSRANIATPINHALRDTNVRNAKMSHSHKTRSRN